MNIAMSEMLKHRWHISSTTTTNLNAIWLVCRGVNINHTQVACCQEKYQTMPLTLSCKIYKRFRRQLSINRSKLDATREIAIE